MHFAAAVTSPSSRGLGHRPFTAATPVRIRLGTPEKSVTYRIRRKRVSRLCPVWTLLGSLLPPRPAHHEIGIPLPAFGTAQQPRPIGNRHPRAVLRDLDSDIDDISAVTVAARSGPA